MEFDKKVNNRRYKNRSKSVERRRQMVAIFQNCGSQLTKCGKSNDHSRDIDIIEYSVNQFGKNVAEEARRQKKMQKKVKEYRQERDDDDELINPSVFAERIRNESLLIENGPNETVSNMEPQFNPYEWMWSLTNTFEQEENIDDCREAETDEGYQTEQVREELPNCEKVQEPKRIWKKLSFRKDRKRTGRNRKLDVEIGLPPEVPIGPSRLTRSASKSSKPIVTSAKMVGKMPLKLVTSSSRLLSSAVRSSKKGITNGHRKSLPILTHSGEKTKKPSRSLAETVARMLDANQNKEASELLVGVHEMMQKPEGLKSTETFLESMEAHIRDKESKASQNRMIGMEKKKDVEGEFNDDREQEAASPGFPQLMSIRAERTEADEGSYTDYSEYDCEREGDSYSNEDEIYTDWDDFTRKSDSSRSCTTGYTDYQDDSEPEIEGLTLYRDFLSEDILSERSEFDSGGEGYVSGTSVYVNGDKVTGVNILEGSVTEDESSDDGLTSGSTSGYDSGTLAVDYANISDEEDELLTYVLSERDQAMLYMIENDVQQLEDAHEQEKQGWLYQTFHNEE